MLHQILTIIHILIALILLGLVLLQQGKGSEVGAAFGGGASQTIFGSRGSANFLTHTTAVVAAVFFITSLTLTYMASQQVKETDAPIVAIPTEEKKLPISDIPLQQSIQPAQPLTLPGDAATPDVPVLGVPVEGNQDNKK